MKILALNLRPFPEVRYIAIYKRKRVSLRNEYLVDVGGIFFTFRKISNAVCVIGNGSDLILPEVIAVIDNMLRCLP